MQQTPFKATFLTLAPSLHHFFPSKYKINVLHLLLFQFLLDSVPSLLPLFLHTLSISLIYVCHFLFSFRLLCRHVCKYLHYYVVLCFISTLFPFVFHSFILFFIFFLVVIFSLFVYFVYISCIQSFIPSFLNPFSAGTDFRRHILTSKVDHHTGRIKCV